MKSDALNPACRKCGRALSSNDPRGLCARCLVVVMLEGGSLPGLVPSSGQGTALPRTFGGYELLEVVARGGMGIVYRARQLHVNRLVAVKVLASGAFAAPDFVKRFRTEAEAVASLDHPHIVPIYEVGECEGQPFFSMKFVESGTLAGRIGQAKSPLTNAEAANLLAKLAHAVHFAHQRGILHRDIKPGNVLMDAQGEPLLTDFGLAKLVEKESTLTRTVAMLGTPSYMSPEQARGEARQLTTGVDVYGLGAVFYELLTGQPPFAGGTTMETVRQVLEKEPRRPAALRPDTDRELESICLKCLEKDPARRYASAEALAQDVERWQRQEPVSARPPSALYVLQKMVRRNKVRAALLAAIALLLVGGLGISLWQARVQRGLRERAEVNERAALAARREASTHAEQRREQLVRLHLAAGNKLVEDGDTFMGLLQFVEALRLDQGDAAREDLHRRRFAAVLRTAPRLAKFWPNAGGVSTARFSPDGRRVVCGNAQGAVQVFDAATAEPLLPTPIKTSPSTVYAWFTHEGRFLATVDTQGGLQHWDANTGEPSGPLLPTDVSSQRPRIYSDCVDYSADGRLVIATLAAGAQLYAVPTGEPIGPLLSATSVVHGVRFSPDGQTAMLWGEEPAVQLVEVPSGRPVWTPTDVKGPVQSSAFSPDGALVVTMTETANQNGSRQFYGGLDVWDVAQGVRLFPTVFPDGVNRGLQFSPDGKWLAAANTSFTRMLDARTGRAVRQSMTHNGNIVTLEFSPDSRRLATASYDRTARIWDVATGRSLFPVLRHAEPVHEARFSPDGGRLLTTSADATVRLWALPRGSGERLSLPNKIEGRVRVHFSPDGGSLLAFGESDSVHVWDARTADLKATLDHHCPVSAASFDRNGTRVVVAGTNGDVRVWDWVAQEDSFLVRHTAAVNHVEFSPDGKLLLTASDDATARLWNGTDGSPALPPLSHESAVRAAAFSADGQRIVTGALDGTVRIWDASTGTQISRLKTASNLLALALTADGRRLLTLWRGPASRTQLWDAQTGARVGPGVPLYGNGLYPATFSPDGQRYLLLYDVNSVAIMDAETGQRIAPLLRHEGLPVWFGFSPDGTMVLTCEQGAARIWDAKTGEPVTPSFRHDTSVTWGAWSPDGREVATSTHGSFVRVWNVSPFPPALATLERQAELLAAHRLDPKVGPVPLTPNEMAARWQEMRNPPANR